MKGESRVRGEEEEKFPGPPFGFRIDTAICAIAAAGDSPTVGCIYDREPNQPANRTFANWAEANRANSSFSYSSTRSDTGANYGGCCNLDSAFR